MRNSMPCNAGGNLHAKSSSHDNGEFFVSPISARHRELNNSSHDYPGDETKELASLVTSEVTSVAQSKKTLKGTTAYARRGNRQSPKVAVVDQKKGTTSISFGRTLKSEVLN